MKRVVFLILIACLCLVGCKKIEYVYVPKVQTLTRDSIVYNFVFRNDTIRTNRTDSIPYPVEVPKYIEKKLNGYQRTMISLGWVLILSVVGFIGYKGLKFYLTKKL